MNKSAIIKARHLWKTIVLGGKEVPLEKSFTDKAWRALGHINHDNKQVPKHGFVQIANVKAPPEATAKKEKDA